jgi:cell division protein FtsL
MKKQQPAPRKPIIKFRMLAAGSAAVALLIAGPMLVVWKQVYINAASMKLEAMNDSLTQMQREIATLRLSCERLSATGRIESFARSVLQLDYPVSSQIEIVRTAAPQRGFMHGAFDFMALLKKTVSKDKS